MGGVVLPYERWNAVGRWYGVAAGWREESADDVWQGRGWDNPSSLRAGVAAQ